MTAQIRHDPIEGTYCTEHGGDNIDYEDERTHTVAVCPECPQRVPVDAIISDRVTGRELLAALREVSELEAYVEQTGGNCATIYLGQPDATEHYPLALGPGSFNWTDPDGSEFDFGELYVGPDDDGLATADRCWSLSDVKHSAARWLTPLIDRVRETLPNAHEAWFGCWDPDSAIVEWSDGVIVATHLEEDYLIGIYTETGYQDGHDAEALLALPDKNAVAHFIDQVLTADDAPAGPDWLAWAAERCEQERERREGPVPAGPVVITVAETAHEYEGVSPIMVRREAATEYLPERVYCSVVLPNSGHRVNVEAFGPYHNDGEALVNWPAVGAVDPVDAATFATLVRFAATELAPKLAAPGGAQ